MMDYRHGADDLKTRAGCIIVQYNKRTPEPKEILCRRIALSFIFLLHGKMLLYRKAALSRQQTETGFAGSDRDLVSPHVIRGTEALLSKQGALGLGESWDYRLQQGALTSYAYCVPKNAWFLHFSAHICFVWAKAVVGERRRW